MITVWDLLGGFIGAVLLAVAVLISTLREQPCPRCRRRGSYTAAAGTLGSGLAGGTSAAYRTARALDTARMIAKGRAGTRAANIAIGRTIGPYLWRR